MAYSRNPYTSKHPVEFLQKPDASILKASIPYFLFHSLSLINFSFKVPQFQNFDCILNTYTPLQRSCISLSIYIKKYTLLITSKIIELFPSSLRVEKINE